MKIPDNPAPGGPDWPVCAVCARILDRVTDPTGSRYDHGDGEADHPAVPVHPSQLAAVDLRCDFCFTPDPGWTVPVENFRYGVLPDHGSLGDWLACDACAGLILRGLWSDLLRRAVAGLDERQGPTPAAVVDQLSLLHRQLRRHLTGLPTRREGATP